MWPVLLRSAGAAPSLLASGYDLQRWDWRLLVANRTQFWVQAFLVFTYVWGVALYIGISWVAASQWVSGLDC